MPEDAVAVVRGRPITQTQVQDIEGVLGPRAAKIFTADPELRTLRDQAMVIEALVDRGVAAGVDQDPRVEWAVIEELAERHLEAEMQRRVPYERIASDVTRLRAYYDGHPELFVIPEERGLRGYAYPRLDMAVAALDRLQAGTLAIEPEDPNFIELAVHPRDDEARSMMDPVLFTEGLAVGDPLPSVVVHNNYVVAGELNKLVPATREPFDDPAVQEQLVRAVRDPLVAEARQAYLAELRAKANPAS